ncbi:site-specific DNA-methyltransferase [Ottowia beijingensis]|uniref:site-specific DNA-methyltransferase n=1 Tax=Ottowia beijingensis TaxID=1207057 RepID=UPI00214D7A7D|nr:site-specific DNA-methyltransferase [Ottowia beijingensis]
MTTDPGDLVLDPTCGSGTTAYVAEKWGRRWITCDTSRVAITLAKQRLMTASFDYFALRYPHEGCAAASSTRRCRTSRSKALPTMPRSTRFMSACTRPSHRRWRR